MNRFQFSTRSVFVAALVVACAAMAARTWYSESQRPPAPLYDEPCVTADGNAFYFRRAGMRPLEVHSRHVIGTPGDFRWVYRVKYPDHEYDELKEWEIAGGPDAMLAFDLEQQAIERDRRSHNNYALGVEPLIEQEQSFRIQGITIDANTPPRRLIAIRRQKPTLLIGGKIAHESYTYSWVDIDSDLTILNPTIHDEIVGTHDEPFDLHGVYVYGMERQPMIRVAGHYVNLTTTNCAIIDTVFYPPRRKDTDQ